MAVSEAIKSALGSQSMIRRMFEEGARLKKEHGAENVFDFSLGNPDLDPPHEFHETLTALVNEDPHGCHGYMANAGFPEARAAMAEKASAEHGVKLAASHIVMSVGAAGALNAVFKSVLNAGDEVVVPKPFFMEYRAYAANHGGVLLPVPSKPDFSLDLDAIAAALNAKTAAVLINSPNNPTGQVYTKEEIDSLAQILIRHGEKTGRLPYLIADEPYRELAYDGVTVPPVLCAYPASIVVTSFSKNLSLPGERIGYIAVSPACPDAEELLGALIYCTRVLGFVNAPALLQRCVSRLTRVKPSINVYTKRREAFLRVLDTCGMEYQRPKGAFYIFARAPGGDDAAFSEKLKKQLILAVPGSGFACPGWLRFAYCVDEGHIAASLPAFQRALAS